MTEPAALATEPLFGLPLADLWFGLVFFILAMFLFLDGFDFGVGALFATREDDDERERLLAAIGPFWDGNEVWLVVFGGALFAAFPSVYANLFSRHYLLMFAILGALIVRGLAPEMYEQRHDDGWQRWWGRAFVVGSLTAPFFLGMFTANWVTGATSIVTLPALIVGLAVVALTVVDGVAFLRLKTRGDLRDDLEMDGYRALGAYLVLVVAALGSVYAVEPALRSALLSAPVLALVLATLAFAGVYVAATRADRYYAAFGAAAGLVFALVAIVAGLMYPSIDRAAGLTVETAIVSTLQLNLMSVGAAVLLPLVFVYFAVLYTAFSGPIETGESY
ncbi:cytochrome d ubiquinol oxidase, subunit II [Natrinema pellirubrum DSM 15624]|uniref:Cytochrome d oxidase cyd, subunit II n=1 Tax=Natrinema pellirubrum (strain DSM 15624 / CIP 106293 / JCM 10476 / NCIMB 786 / 157) TaxID=797303 RepID=L0JKL4_NATP1|nr:cytochrome d ubiquinol oxidase subunit II [Natrinema pellirubrum]AGB31373.1 cytochrome d oxidase cyd, subunit II [Natrinema pellirubrum DSM 15624]ELY82075.1 cytochrome d ubiquinol oxidase, subunit II [Natrinema pellirubrum DSM 15624]